MLDAVRVGAERAQSVAYGGGFDTVGAGEGGGGEGVGDVVRGLRVDVGDVGQLLRLLPAVVDERAVDQDPVHDAELGGRWGAEGESDGPAALFDVGGAHQSSVALSAAL